MLVGTSGTFRDHSIAPKFAQPQRRKLARRRRQKIDAEDRPRIGGTVDAGLPNRRCGRPARSGGAVVVVPGPLAFPQRAKGSTGMPNRPCGRANRGGGTVVVDGPPGVVDGES